MFSDVDYKIKKKHKILFTKDSICLNNLIHLMDNQNHRVLVLWALNAAKEPLEILKSTYQNENRPLLCIEKSDSWAKGEIPMKIAKKAILDVHHMAKEIHDEEMIALCHAIGHAGATVHVKTHAIGFVIYELTAIVLRNHKENYQEAITRKIEEYETNLKYWMNHEDIQMRKWAKFL
ncbi:MAG: hypothetical protein EOM11_09625 [Erysipelotrichia bacterium]|nr:hypothetical protein [Erysipelotrichia bacterium]